MPIITDPPPADIQRELDNLRAALIAEIPAKRLEQNLLIATWNVRAFGDITRKWASGPNDTPKRDLHATRCIAEIISHFDVIAVQEVKANIRGLRDVMRLLGNDWGLILTDVNRGNAGNDERMAFIFDTRRVQLSGLACELVVPQEQLQNIAPDALQRQFARTPYAVGFRSAGSTFVLVTLHILFGSNAKQRIPELKAIANWMSDWAKRISDYEQNLLALGDFNIDARGDVLAQTFLAEGLHIPTQLEQVTRSIFDETKFYDHIAWFDGAGGRPKLSMEFQNGGNFDFVDKVLIGRNLSKQQLSFMLSDHYPLWAEFLLPQ